MSYRVGLLPLNSFDAAGQETTHLTCSQMVLEPVFDNWLPRMSESHFSCPRERSLTGVGRFSLFRVGEWQFCRNGIYA